MGRPCRRANEGIIAREVKAEVIAVGRGARAQKTVPHTTVSMPELRAAVRELGCQITDLKLDATSRKELALEFRRLKAGAEARTVNHQNLATRLRALADRIKAIGELGTGSVAIIETIRRIQQLLR